ncbi:GhoT/OrtT family toxin [Yersinia intermedia]|nr:GhoT/OrtT family toxin [Yersinia intermedia]
MYLHSWRYCLYFHHLPLTRDQSLLVRWLSASLIGITWPLSLPVALLLSMF